jgi:hypothetical protein
MPAKTRAFIEMLIAAMATCRQDHATEPGARAAPPPTAVGANTAPRRLR